MIVFLSNVPFIGERYRNAGVSFWVPFRTVPFCCACPFAICCVDSNGACSAEIADAAVGPDDAEEMACGLAADMPAVGSDFPGGHIPLFVFFRVAHPSAVIGVFPFVGADDAVIVEAIDTCELRDALELVR